ncbi:hypothetical protein KSP40_PGU001532 [Platanthera guangdongensis]|uniref:DNA polymerase delta subunit 4 n=1 Tax=Platanthera guangdongensis TaxID=2320717 RepID=A0ABR2MTB8_9ASPA
MASGGINRFYKERKKSSVGKPSPSFKDKKSVGSPTATVGALIPSEDDGSEDRLRQFDLDWRYSPCIGMTRMEHWNRAMEMGLQPPTDRMAPRGSGNLQVGGELVRTSFTTDLDELRTIILMLEIA